MWSTLVELMFSRWPYKTHIARGSVTVDTQGLRYVTLSCFGFTEQPDKTTFGNVNMLKLHGSRRARPGVSNTISFNPICCESSLGRKRMYICLDPSAVLCAGLRFCRRPILLPRGKTDFELLSSEELSWLQNG